MKKFMIILAVALTLLFVSACASISHVATFNGNNSARIQRRGEQKSTVWFGLFGERNYPPIDKVATDNGITQIATVERYYKVGTFALWVEYTTIVTGN